MANIYAQVKLRNGDVMISEFEKLNGLRRLSADVMSGRKAFPIWRPVADRHPLSGEAVSIRRRVFVNGTEIVEMEQVRPTIEDHNYDPANFEPEPHLAGGQYGRWTAPDSQPEDWPEGAPYEAGTEYKIHRDQSTFRRYVIAKAGDPQSDDVVEQANVLFWLDRPAYEAAPAAAREADVDDGDGDWEDYDEDEAADVRF